MNKTFIAVAVLAAVISTGAQASGPAVYEAVFRDLGNGSIQLDGFGRGAADRSAADGTAAPGSTTATEFFLDTWNIRTNDIQPGVYSALNMVVDAFNGVVFSAVSLSSYDALGVRNIVRFDLNALGTQAVGAGSYTVLASCPVVSCVWIDVFGTQPVGGGGGAGYGGQPVATIVPEPAGWALMALGLVAVGGCMARRRPTGAPVTWPAISSATCSRSAAQVTCCSSSASCA